AFENKDDQSDQNDRVGVSIIMPERPTHEMISSLRNIFKESPGHEPVYLIVESGDRKRKVSTEYSVERSQKVLQNLAKIVGGENVI
ncbi:MAG: hypothetical protein ABH846_02865, partial [Patescibacteria group bacterium]